MGPSAPPSSGAKTSSAGGLALCVLVFLVALAVLVVLRLSCSPPRVSTGSGLRARRPAPPAAHGGAESKNVVVDTLNLAYALCARGRELEACSARGQGRGSAGRKRPARRRECPLSWPGIVSTIVQTAPVLRRKFPGRVVYVLKDRDGGLAAQEGLAAREENTPKDPSRKKAAVGASRRSSVADDPEARQTLWRLAQDLRVSIHVATHSATPPPAWQVKGSPEPTHQKSGRDDFYAGLLASRMKCPVLTNDRMRDFQELKHEVPPFRVLMFDHWAPRPHEDRVYPGAPDYARLRAPPQVRPDWLDEVFA